jgi:predicted deacylase
MEMLVDLNSDIKEGDTIAVQLDAFGDENETDFAGVSGKVLSVAKDPIRNQEPCWFEFVPLHRPSQVQEL